VRVLGALVELHRKTRASARTAEEIVVRGFIRAGVANPRPLTTTRVMHIACSSRSGRSRIFASDRLSETVKISDTDEPCADAVSIARRFVVTASEGHSPPKAD
jgi:hypothetical protein